MRCTALACVGQRWECGRDQHEPTLAKTGHDDQLRTVCGPPEAIAPGRHRRTACLPSPMPWPKNERPLTRMTSVRPGVGKQWPGECGREERQHRAEDQEPDCVGEEPKRGLQIIIPATYFAPDDGAQPIQIAGSQEHPLLTHWPDRGERGVADRRHRRAGR